MLRDKDMYRLRALQMLDRKIRGASHKTLALEFGCSDHTVERSLDYAKRAGLIAGFEDQILQKLVPSAIAALGVALEENDAQVALEILKGTGLLRKQADKPLVPVGPEEDFELFIKKVRTNALPQVVPAQIANGGEAAGAAPTVLDGVVGEDPAPVDPTPPTT